ncbi:MAG: Hsp20/alpha crystallin family protein [Cyanobacteria bacterium SZAS LIN-5]|nr:Hsp20/alpha crystallin family protein [Cyanobacteria bacterium SZAS LIN-5]RTL38124.1 MAG: Hsp20/alpha crystallin family protein [Candidatus Melainabacteria bacterium]
MFNLKPWSHKRTPARVEEDHPVYALQKEMNKVFENFFRYPGFGDFADLGSLDKEFLSAELAPRIDMVETEKEVVIKVELPGMNEKDINVSVNNELLTISGEKKQEKEQSEKGWYRMERQYGSFCRNIPLPYEVESDKVDAVYKNGILSLKLPKSAVQQKAAKRIEVKSA